MERARRDIGRVCALSEAQLEVVHEQDIGDLSSVVLRASRRKFAIFVNMQTGGTYTKNELDQTKY